MSQLALFAVMIAVMYLLLIRPQQKRAKEHKTMLDALAKGDEIVAGGIAGRVAKVGENFIAVEIAAGVEVQVQKNMIQLVLPKGTLKSL